ncbi:MAG: CBU_0592 family membrane protein [Parvularcula sp.]
MQDWQFTFPDAVGFLGVALLIGTYAGLQVGKLSADRPAYSALNGIAALLIGYSLLFTFNAASMVIEVFWFGISLYGFIRALRAKSK